MKFIYAIILILVLSISPQAQLNDYAVGDLNLNNIPYEISDAVLFSNYFVYGPDVFNGDLNLHRLASDVNQDGEYFHVSDLIYLIRIIIGDASPYVKGTTDPARKVKFSVNNDIYSTTYGLCMISMTVEGNQTPELLDGNKEMLYNFDGTNTNILIYSIHDLEPLAEQFVMVSGKLLSIQAGDVNGNKVDLEYVEPPQIFLTQNYPNPFGPLTSIQLHSAIETEVEVGIFNLLGQRVFTWHDHVNAGITEIDWNAGDLAPGIYFYKIMNHSSPIKKMVLFK